MTEENTVKTIIESSYFEEEDSASILEFEKTYGGWKCTCNDFSTTSRVQNPRRYFLNENSGMEVVLCKCVNAIGYLSIINDELGAPGIDQMIVLPVNGNEALIQEVPTEETLETDDFRKAWGAYVAYQQGPITPAFSMPEYLTIDQMILSPDGYYALLLMKYPEICPDNEMLYEIKTGLCVLDLLTLKFARIEMPENININEKTGFIWNEANEIMLSSNDGTLYTLQID